MLTEAQYKKLLRYRDNNTLFNEDPDETMMVLLEKRYVLRYHPTLQSGEISKDTFCAISQLGKQALEEFEDQVHKESAEQEKNKNVMKVQRSANRFDTIAFGTISAVVGSVIGGLVVYYWPKIFRFLESLFH